MMFRISPILLVSGFTLITLVFSFSSNSGDYKLKDISTQFHICPTHKNSLCKVDFHPEGELVASSGFASEVKIWNSKNGEIIHSLIHPEGVPGLDFSDDGLYLATGSYDGKVRIWQVSNGLLFKEFVGHQDMVLGVAFSPDGEHLASVSADDTARIWDIATGNSIKLSAHQGDVWGIAFSPDGQFLLTGGEDEKINIWNGTTGELLSTLSKHSGAVLALAFSHNGRLLASGGDDYIIKIWDTQSWQVLRTIEGDSYSIYGLTFSPDDSMLASGNRDKSLVGEFFQYHWGSNNDDKNVTVRLWDVARGNLLQELSGHSDDVNQVVFSPDGRTLASSSVDGSVIMWDVETLLSK